MGAITTLYIALPIIQSFRTGKLCEVWTLVEGGTVYHLVPVRMGEP